MDAYLNLRLLPDPEFPAPLLMNALFSKLHRGLVDHGGQCIGVSFPELNEAHLATGYALGLVLRLHSRSEELTKLMAQPWLGSMRDHVGIGPISPVPANSRHRIVRRVQCKSSPTRERRRLMARQGLDHTAACQRIPEDSGKRLPHPFINLGSRSTGQQFSLFIEHLPPGEIAQTGPFSAYGLSPTATVPWF